MKTTCIRKSILTNYNVPGSNGVIHNGITCFKCNKPGHFADKCTKSKTGVMGLQYGVCFTHGGENVRIKKVGFYWICVLQIVVQTTKHF